MNIYDYIDDYGIYSFEEKKFNEIDAVLFSFISYANFQEILKENERKKIKEIGRIHLGMYPNKDKNIIAVKEGNKLLRYIKDCKRYKDCILFNYEYIGNTEVQFGALSIEYEKNHIFVSFEGTDQLFSGWKENFILSYEFPTKSQELAKKYLDKHYTFALKKIIVGGHSKGGNLALVGSMNANLLVQKKIKKIINCDGPGLLDKEFLSNKYQKIKSKYIHIIPDETLVGLFLNHSNDKIIKSNIKGILAHNIIYWRIAGTHFEEVKQLSPLSEELDKEIKTWFKQYSEEDKKNFVTNLDQMLKKANISSITELKENQKKIIDLIYESKDLTDHTKKVLLDFITMILKCIRNVKKEEWKQFLSDMFRIKNGTE